MRSAVGVAAAVAACMLAAVAAGAQPTVRLPAQDRTVAARFAPVFQVGEAEGRSWEVFSEVRQLAFDARDNLYVLDRGNARVLVFDRTGRFVRQVGKRGGGPGEFTSPARLSVTRDGSLVVADQGRRAFSIFDAQGRFTRSVPYDAEFGISGQGMEAHPRGGVVTGALPIPLGGGTPQNSVLWYPLARAGATALLRVADEPAETSEPARSGGTRTRVITSRKPAFAPTLRWGLLPSGGVVAATSAEYRLTVTDDRGTAVWVLERPIRPRAVTQRDRDAELARRQEGGGRDITVLGGGGSLESLPPEVRGMVQSALRDVEFARVIPVVRRLAADPAGRIWVGRAGPDAGRPGPVDLLAADGRYLGTLAAQEVPDAFSPSGARAAYITRDEEGVERVVVRTIPALPR
ncbi:MAG TPA: 6-bladed beta-propeller [Longimicrobium sp.]|nr:6-bladed beta-propeller [Longimicrobium sp.]